MDTIEVRRCKNGYIVMPGSNPQRGYTLLLDEIYVFRDFDEMAEWLEGHLHLESEINGEASGWKSVDVCERKEG